MANGNRPTPEFRRQAVRLALTRGRTRREIADDLPPDLSSFRSWFCSGYGPSLTGSGTPAG